jgi:hypothetical protein
LLQDSGALQHSRQQVKNAVEDVVDAKRLLREIKILKHFIGELSTTRCLCLQHGLCTAAGSMSAAVCPGVETHRMQCGLRSATCVHLLSARRTRECGGAQRPHSLPVQVRP